MFRTFDKGKSIDRYSITEPATRGEDDEDFDPRKPNQKQKAKKPASAQPPVENARKEQHTLEEHHEHLLTTSFDASFVGNLPGLDSYSSQNEPAIGLDFNDQTIFDFSDGMELGDVPGLGDDLAREIGWASPEKRTTRYSSTTLRKHIY